MPSRYQKYLAYIHALAFGDFARGPLHVRGPVGGGCRLWRKDLDTIDSSAELVDGPASTGKGARLFSRTLLRMPAR